MEAELAHILQQTEESYKAVHPNQAQKQSDWEKWYAQWLLMFFDLECIFHFLPTKDQLEILLLQGESAFTLQNKVKSWSEFVAKLMYTQLQSTKN